MFVYSTSGFLTVTLPLSNSIFVQKFSMNVRLHLVPWIQTEIFSSVITQ